MIAKTKPAEQLEAVLELEPKTAQLPVLAGPSEQVNPFRAVEMAVERNMPVDVIEKLIGAAERMEAMRERERLREAELSFRRAFADFTGENVIVPKTKTVNRAAAGSFEQAEFDKVMGMLRPPLSKHGFGIRHDMKFGAKEFPPDVEGEPPSLSPWVWVTCHLEHREGHAEKLELDGPAGAAQGNTVVQNQQVTGSYFKRQSALSITGTPTADEDNEERMVRKEKSAAKQGEFEELQAAGRAAAIEGTAALTSWWAALDNKQRSLMNREFGVLRKAAAANDKPVDHSQEARNVR